MTFTPRTELLVDSNLLVLYVVGTVNPDRIATFKRTSRYNVQHFRFLSGILEKCSRLHAVPHALAEVSNLVDLKGRERALAFDILKTLIGVLKEADISSAEASQGRIYSALGLTDSSIAEAAARLRCDVLTDDLDLWLALSRQGIPAHNFMHLCAEFVERA
ncbi:MAG: hypothetical protein KJZ79_20500 [Bryobacteraceae bacterium]|nr:hypothetical protein [Bryobacteraceae bacterium]